MLVRPAPLPKKAPAKRLLALVKTLAPEKVLDPAKAWFPLSRGTLAESRASAKVPDATLAALRSVRPEPLPLKVPVNRLFAFVIALTPLNVLEPVKVWFVL